MSVRFCGQELFALPGRKLRDSHAEAFVDACLSQGGGVIPLVGQPSAREFCTAGKFMRRRYQSEALSPQAIAPGCRGSVTLDELWGLCTIEICTGLKMANGSPIFREGLTHAWNGEHLMLFQDLIEAKPDLILGSKVAARCQRVFGRVTAPIVSKRFDNQEPIPVHEHAAGELAKPEVHIVMSWDNPHVPGCHSYAHAIGLKANVTHDNFLRCMKQWGKRPEGNGVLDLCTFHRMPVGTGSFVCPPELLHAPGALCTHEVHIAGEGGKERLAAGLGTRDQHRLYQDVIPEGSLTMEQACAAAPIYTRPSSGIWTAEDLTNAVNFPLNLRQDLMDEYLRPNLPATDWCGNGVTATWSAYGNMPAPLETAVLHLVLEPGAKMLLRGLPSAAYFFLSWGEGTVGKLECAMPWNLRFDGTVPIEAGWVIPQIVEDGIPIHNTGTAPLVITFNLLENVFPK